MSEQIRGQNIQEVLTSTHWGTYTARVEDGRLVGMTPWAQDPDPSKIGQSMPGAVDGPLRVKRPSFRKAWLERAGARATGRRGAGPFVELPWDEALDLVSSELDRVRRDHGNSAIYGGSYGWASTGRFHHAQSQLHRFLNMAGGYTASVNTYSYAAAEVILPHVIGNQFGLVGFQSNWQGIIDQGQLVLAFGGMPRRNAQVQSGALGRHSTRAAMEAAAARGLRLISLSPVRDDGPDGIDYEWQPLIPGVDTAVMLGMARVLIDENLADRTFLARNCVGFDRVEAYITGASDGTPKTPEWAEAISGLPAARIRELARMAAGMRTMIMVNWAIQRADHGEQPYWMAITLAAMLGQIGLPGGGFGFGYSSTNAAGRNELPIRWPSLNQGINPLRSRIPVARVTDMLLNPGQPFDYDGERLTYPDIRLIWWAGGNPFHHHQDLNRLVEGWQRPETVIVSEPYWTATARHADIVLPVTTTMERDDLAMSNREPLIVAMKRLIEPVAEARDDHQIFAGIARRLGFEQKFTEDRTTEDWLRAFYNRAQQNLAAHGAELPGFDAFWNEGSHEVDLPVHRPTLLSDFRADPEGAPLNTPSGRIELYSETIAAFGYADCPGHATWLPPREGRAAGARALPLHLLTPQPADKLHSQYDHGSVSCAAKIAGRTRLRIHPQDAEARGIRDGDLCRVFNARGACLTGAELVNDMIPGVIQIPTGSWFDPSDPLVSGSLEVHGNPNVLTPDRGTSSLGQGCSANSALVEVELFTGEPPAISVNRPPEIVAR